MVRLSSLLLVLVILAGWLVSFVASTPPTVDRAEAHSAFELLNRIRKNPVAYCQQLKFSPVQVVPRPALIWNDTLALAAERKALDMAKRNYYAHIDPDGFGMNHYIALAGYTLNPTWLVDPKANNFESIHVACANGEEVITGMILDKGVESKGHRAHLLGIGEWDASLVDIGIGFARSDSSSKYPTYACVLIAKHR